MQPGGEGFKVLAVAFFVLFMLESGQCFPAWHAIFLVGYFSVVELFSTI
jgi:hypothetical protein